ncbi:hypothetical protein ON010_g1759 [Phytophthora cinnamomi]|nr:hypothetical protein ON010_g1759 [Phytophthora cinnamomi]
MDDLKTRLSALQRIFPVCTRASARIQIGNQKLGIITSGYTVEIEPNPCAIARGDVVVGGFHRLRMEPIMNVIVKPRAGATDPEGVQCDNLNGEEKLEALRTSLALLHEDVTDEKERRRLRQQAAKKGKKCAFSMGWALPSGGRLPTSFLIEHLLTGETFDVHVIRINHYADDMHKVTEELKHHVGLQRIKLGVLRWQGLEETEDSWESVESVNAAVPEQIKDFVTNTAGIHAQAILQ